MKTLITIIALISISPVFAEVVKVDDYSLKQITEQVYTYEQIQDRINSLKAERDGQQNNLNLLNAEIARLEKMIADTGITAVKAKVVEAVEESDKLEQGE